MRVQIRAATVSKTLRIHVQGRLGLALGRFADRIERVTVRITKLGGERRCRIDVIMRGRMIRVEGLDVDAVAAAEHAISRAGSSVVRAIEAEQ